MTTPALLEEVSEQTAAGSIADTYADIRRVLGVPMVVLVYRALAAQPGRLEHIWSVLAANLAARDTQRNAESICPPEIGSVEPVPRAFLTAARLDRALLADTLDAFDRANRLNLIGLTSLLVGAPGNPSADSTPGPSETPRKLLPMAELASLPQSTLELLQRISVPLAGPGPPIVIPSLFRYFAHDHELLEKIWHTIGHAITSDRFPSAVIKLSTHARVLAGRLPYSVPRVDDHDTREIATRFTTVLPAMIVTTNLVRLALAELTAPRDDACICHSSQVRPPAGPT